MLQVCVVVTARNLDGDGICDDIDPCIGIYDVCGVCNGPGAIYECGCDGIPMGQCDCVGNYWDFNQNGVCDNLETYGCTYPGAINFLDSATTDDGSCIFLTGDLNGDGAVGVQDCYLWPLTTTVAFTAVQTQERAISIHSPTGTTTLACMRMDWASAVVTA